jgi:ERF superfamily
VKETTEALTVQQSDVQPSNMMEAFIKISTSPGVSIDVIERMAALQERWEARQREQIFMSCLAQLQAKMPLIYKGGTNKHTGTHYARREDIQQVIQPLLKEFGFAFSFNEEDCEGGMKKFSAKLSHEDGHSETKFLKVPVDESAKNKETGKPVRTGIQDMGSTTSYAVRYLIKMHLNIAETDEDTDGNSAEKITDNQVKDLAIAVQDAGMDKGRFFVFMGVGDFNDILAADLKKALNAIDTKRRDNAAKGQK